VDTFVRVDTDRNEIFEFFNEADSETKLPLLAKKTTNDELKFFLKVFKDLLEGDAEFGQIYIDRFKTVLTRISHTGRFDCRAILTKVLQVRLQVDENFTKELAKEVETKTLAELKNLPILSTQPTLYGGLFTLTSQNLRQQQTQASLVDFAKNKQRLEISLKSGHNLAIKDTGGTSDPYVDIELYSKEGYESKKPTYYGRIQSKIIDKNLNPIWDQKWMLTQLHTDELYIIKFVVWDFDTFGANDFMGEAIVKREEIEKKNCH